MEGRDRTEWQRMVVSVARRGITCGHCEIQCKPPQSPYRLDQSECVRLGSQRKTREGLPQRWPASSSSGWPCRQRQLSCR